MLHEVIDERQWVFRGYVRGAERDDVAVTGKHGTSKRFFVEPLQQTNVSKTEYIEVFDLSHHASERGIVGGIVGGIESVGLYSDTNITTKIPIPSVREGTGAPGVVARDCDVF